MFVSAISLKDTDEGSFISVKYIGADGPVTRHKIEPTAMFNGAWLNLKQAVLMASGIDLSFWSLDAFQLIGMKVNLTKLGKELLEEGESLDSNEYDSVDLSLVADATEDAPGIHYTSRFSVTSIISNESLSKTFEAVTTEAIKSIEQPVKREVLQLRLQLEEPQNKVAQLMSINNLDNYTYDPDDLRGNDGSELKGSALEARKQSLVRKGKAVKKAS